MRFKRLLVILLIITVLCVAVACNDDSDTQTPDNVTDDTTDIPSGDNTGTPSGGDDDVEGDEPAGSKDEEETPALEYESDGEFYYTSVSDGYAVVKAVDPDIITAVIPAEFNSKPVTRIADEAFYNSDFLDAVTLPKTVVSIGDRAFSLCYELESVIFEEGSELNELGCGVFRCAESLESIDFPQSLTSIGSDCFNEAKELLVISGLDNVIRIGRDAFKDTAYMVKQSETPGLVVIGKTAYDFIAAEGYSGTLDVYSGVESIADGAFENADTVFEVKIAATVTHIGEGAFACSDKIEKISVDAGNPVYYSEDNAVLYKNGDTVTLIRGTNTVPEGVTHIAAKAFSGSAVITEADIPDTVVSIGKEAFRDCRKLETVTIPEGIRLIDEYSFWGALELQSVTVPASVREIAGTAFSGCEKLLTVTIDSPYVIEAATMALSVGHLLEYAETVYIPEIMTEEEYRAAAGALEEQFEGEELTAKQEELTAYYSAIKNASSDYLAAAFSKVISDLEGYRKFTRN